MCAFVRNQAAPWPCHATLAGGRATHALPATSADIGQGRLTCPPVLLQAAETDGDLRLAVGPGSLAPGAAPISKDQVRLHPLMCVSVSTFASFSYLRLVSISPTGAGMLWRGGGVGDMTAGIDAGGAARTHQHVWVRMCACPSACMLERYCLYEHIFFAWPVCVRVCAHGLPVRIMHMACLCVCTCALLEAWHGCGKKQGVPVM